jgi:hypothetical protein
MAVGCPGLDIFDACLLYFNWHLVEEGRIGTAHLLVGNGMAVMTDMLEDISKLFYQKYLILGGTGKYAGATGWINSDYFITLGLIHLDYISMVRIPQNYPLRPKTPTILPRPSLLQPSHLAPASAVPPPPSVGQIGCLACLALLVLWLG